jgi:carbamoyltransferase
MIILGLNVFHGDASACLIKNGILITAIEEERFTRVKHTAGFPVNAIKSCLQQSQIQIDDVNFITINRNPSLRLFKKVKYAVASVFFIKKFFDRYQNYKKVKNLEDEFQNHFEIKNSLKDKIKFIDHHLSHAASSVLMSGFNSTSYLTLDGFGDFVSTTLGRYENQKFYQIKEVNFPHSLGIFYTMMTQFLGFKHYGDEYKVMGLSAYGIPRYCDKIYEILNFSEKEIFQLNLKYFKHHKGIESSWLENSPEIENLYTNELIELFGHPRDSSTDVTSYHKDVAASVQKVYEEIFIKILQYLYEITKNPNLCISGGCALNSLANGKVKFNTKFKNIYIPHSPGDSGGSIGSSMFFLNKNKINFNTLSFETPYLGPEYNDEIIEKIINSNKEKFNQNNIKLKKLNKIDLPNVITTELCNQKIIGLFHGKSEFGARALGNRSIIADPRNKNIKEIINLKIKKREGFRPFAPAILFEHVKEWFDCDDENVNYMSKVYPVKKEKINFVPAIVHVDNTGRLQAVKEKDNFFFYKIIESFYQKTKVPIILNTSFNENEPIVNSPQEAIDCFLRTDMDILILEGFFISR